MHSHSKKKTKNSLIAFSYSHKKGFMHAFSYSYKYIYAFSYSYKYIYTHIWLFFLLALYLLSYFWKSFIFLIFQSNYNFEHTQWNLIWNLRGLVRRETRKRKWESRFWKMIWLILESYGQKLRAMQRTIFKSRYGNLLELLEVQVQVHVITALVQYYHHPLRCFTFCDF